jgi:hypothetical protein
MHFMRCLTRHDPDAHARPTWEPGRIMRDFAHRVETFAACTVRRSSTP